MGRTTGKATKENILFQAFILFSKKPYDQVTFENLEKATGLSRGALLYHVRSKINLFNEVIEFCISNRSSIMNIPIQDEYCLKNFILDFIDKSETAIKTMNNYGIKNINLAYFNIESQAHYFYDNYNQLSKQWVAMETKAWAQVINKAVEKGEIRNNTDIDKLALLFEKLYLGHAYAAVSEKKGCDVNLLKDEFFSLYNLVKA